jgi:hypothetical protein
VPTVPGCTDVISALGSYATMSFSADKTGDWATGLEGAVNGPLVSLSKQQQGVTTDPSAPGQRLLGEETAVYDEAIGLADDVRGGLAGNPGQVPDDLTYIRGNIAQVYAICGQRMPSGG